MSCNNNRRKGRGRKEDKPISCVLRPVPSPPRSSSDTDIVPTVKKSTAEELTTYLEKVVPITQLFAVFQEEKTLVWITNKARANAEWDPEHVVILLDTFSACVKFAQLIDEDKSLVTAKRYLNHGEAGRVKPRNMLVLEKLLSLSSSFYVPFGTCMAAEGGGDATYSGEFVIPKPKISGSGKKKKEKVGAVASPTVISGTLSFNVKIGNHSMTPHELSKTVLSLGAISKALAVQDTTNEEILRMYDFIRNHEGDSRKVLLDCKLEVGFRLESVLHIRLNKKRKWIQISSRKPGKEIVADVEYLWEIVTASDRAFFLPLGYVFEHADMVREVYNEKVMDVLISLEDMQQGEVILYSYTSPQLHPYKISMRVTIQMDDGGKNLGLRWIFKMESAEKIDSKEKQPSKILFRYLSRTRLLHMPKPVNSSKDKKDFPFEVLACDVSVIPPDSVLLEKEEDEDCEGTKHGEREEHDNKVTYKEEACQTVDCDMSKLIRLPDSFNLVEEFPNPYCSNHTPTANDEEDK